MTKRRISNLLTIILTFFAIVVFAVVGVWAAVEMISQTSSLPLNTFFNVLAGILAAILINIVPVLAIWALSSNLVRFIKEEYFK